jgi:hypothetical protein
MRRIVFMVTVALVMAAMVALTGPAFATIHPLANSECANAAASDVANEQLPPGLSPASVDPELTGKSQGSPPNNPTGSTLAQPVFAVAGEDLSGQSPALKTPIVFPEPNFCPADE